MLVRMSWKRLVSCVSANGKALFLELAYGLREAMVYKTYAVLCLMNISLLFFFLDAGFSSPISSVRNLCSLFNMQKG